ncbi:MAG: MBOAT family O-acyltransferase [Leptolyngbyaceae cyanobacterium MO_188.B28]|nr:MBOAT family O-acyltransferase [Leptolyngbyaceae cyanobacterium MO_188.B28]
MLVFSTLVDYTAARVIEAAKKPWIRQTSLLVSLTLNLGLLFTFKYADFFSDSAFTLIGIRPWPELNWVLPLGISFYTFQTMSYTIDVYRGAIAAKRSILDVAIYVCFFPQLIAGPIVRSDELIPQLEARASVDWRQIRGGIAQILWGIFKKVYIADPMAHIANEAFASPDMVSGVGLILAAYAFAIQIYCDFSGYSDVAIGSAKLLGIRLPQNFDAPYLACSIRDFWRRWHITLSTWLRDYLYIPLGGNRKGPVRTYANLMITMLLGGLWHGAGWTWVIWGGLQGFLLSVERAMKWERTPKNIFWRAVRWVITFHLICLSWIFFRVNNFQDAVTILQRVGGLASGYIPLDFRPIAVLGLILLIERLKLKQGWTLWFQEKPKFTKWVTIASAIALFFTFAGASNPEFIYFQF